jgi:hypothetical protein
MAMKMADRLDNFLYEHECTYIYTHIYMLTIIDGNEDGGQALQCCHQAVRQWYVRYIILVPLLRSIITTQLYSQLSSHLLNNS